MFGYFQSEEKHLIFTFNKPFCLVSFSDSFLRAGIYGEKAQMFIIKSKWLGWPTQKLEQFSCWKPFVLPTSVSVRYRKIVQHFGGSSFLRKRRPILQPVLHVWEYQHWEPSPLLCPRTAGKCYLDHLLASSPQQPAVVASARTWVCRALFHHSKCGGADLEWLSSGNQPSWSS